MSGTIPVLAASGFGNSAVNGTYTYYGMWNGKPEYSNGTYYLQWYDDHPYFAFHWWIVSTDPSKITLAGLEYDRGADVVSPLGQWELDFGVDPAGVFASTIPIFT